MKFQVLTDLTGPEAPQALPALELLPAGYQGIGRIRGRRGHGGQRRGRDGKSVQLAAAVVGRGEDHSGELRMRGIVQVQGALEVRKEVYELNININSIIAGISVI